MQDGRRAQASDESVLLAYAGLPIAICLVVLMVAPLVTVLGYETVGHRHLDAALNRALAA
jgi:hypothetical protein